MNSSTKIGKFNVHTVNKDQLSNQYLIDDKEYICLIPFEYNKDRAIKSIYVLDYISPITGEPTQSLIIDSVNPDFDKTSYDRVDRALIEEAGLNTDEIGLTVNDIYFLGDIDVNFPVSTKIHCYAVDLTNKSIPEFTRNLSKDAFIKDGSSIKKVGFHQVVSGDFSDSTILAGSFLLASYFN